MESSVESLSSHQGTDSTASNDSMQGIIELLIKNGQVSLGTGALTHTSDSSSIPQRDLNAQYEDDETNQILGHEDVVEYVRQLSAMGIGSLNYEPMKLKHERSALIQQSQEVAVNNYDAFIRTSSCSSQIREQLKDMDCQVRGLSQDLLQIMKAGDTYLQDSKHISKRWKETSLMLSKHPFLLEVLEMPQLMDSAVRNGLYDDALRLYNHVDRLCKRHTASIPLLSTIAKDVQECKEIMTQQLLKELNSSIQLPAALKVVNYLRRMQIMSETELRIKFLTAREEWLQSLIKEIPTTNPLVHINKVIETNRNNMFDIVTQYRAIFPDPEEMTHAPNMMMLQGGTHLVGDPVFSQAVQYIPSSILNSWINYKVKEFLQCLKSDLNKCIEADSAQRQFNYPIESIVEPCYYFGQSMSRIGADFRPALITIFDDIFSKKFKRLVMNATVRFEKSLQSFKPASASVPQHAASQATDATGSEVLKPSCLISYPILAQLLNGLLSAMNDIRHLTPLSLAVSFTQILNNALYQASLAISQYYKVEESSYSDRERQAFGLFCDLYVTELIPHVGKCFERLLPSSAIAKAFGLTVNEMNKLCSTRNDNEPFEKILPGKLNTSMIVGPISHLLPTRQSITLPEAILESPSSPQQKGHISSDIPDPSDKPPQPQDEDPSPRSEFLPHEAPIPSDDSNKASSSDVGRSIEKDEMIQEGLQENLIIGLEGPQTLGENMHGSDLICPPSEHQNTT